MIDTDERVTPELKAAILKVLDAPQRGVIYSIARRNYFLGRFMRHSGWYPDRVMRLYERARYRYNDNLVHESLDSLGAEVVPLKRLSPVYPPQREIRSAVFPFHRVL